MRGIRGTARDIVPDIVNDPLTVRNRRRAGRNARHL
jgi:hypothetical protein